MSMDIQRARNILNLKYNYTQDELKKNYRTTTCTFGAVKEGRTMGCLVNCFQAKLLTIRAVRIRLIVGLPVARSTHEKNLTMFNGFAKPAQRTAWQWRRWLGRGR